MNRKKKKASIALLYFWLAESKWETDMAEQSFSAFWVKAPQFAQTRTYLKIA
jgi:hypothetical protein